jgi:hypothetical protein
VLESRVAYLPRRLQSLESNFPAITHSPLVPYSMFYEDRMLSSLAIDVLSSRVSMFMFNFIPNPACSSVVY